MIERPTCDEKVIYIEQYLWYEFFLSRFFFLISFWIELDWMYCIEKETLVITAEVGIIPIVNVVAIWSIP